ncbi:Rossmann-fold NAD(P)-binding domain-containing protein [Marinitenerispora sediminis]|uniref:NmrA family protein n=1 Tax=Marinitenerispora sediminis TaxID=1931232 RepID=A0A368T366_9ACTN|nr:NAD(P)H-binding protein [Marinitenerispora sediminis]RCV50389.1 NmrA family protein [Marinitenerispora sediminis]RCV53793.1 NmrA family protein [Marinitenerispora sediminis]RCV56473.1 NmrA family protein [Marinitenerispora sediminis]
MYLMAPDGLPVDPDFVAGSVESGVRRIVLLSSRGIETMGDERLLAAERTVRESGADWTVIRPDWFDQKSDEGIFRAAILAGELALPLGDLRQVFVDVGDIAAVAAAALTEDGHSGQSYEVTGPRALSFGEALSIVGAAAGREVRYRGEPGDYLAARAAQGATDEQARAEAAAFAALRGVGDGAPTEVVRRVAGRGPKSFESYAAEAAASGAWRR